MASSKALVRICLAGGMLAASPSAVAHHSPAMFDGQRTVTLSGTVRQFQWTNPHCYIQLVVTDERGAAREWSLEMGAPIYLYNRGWRPSTLKAGDRIRVTASPLRNGNDGGLVQEVTSLDGKQLGRVQ